MMKRITKKSLVIVLAIIIMLAAITPAFAETIFTDNNGFSYTQLDGNNASLCDWEGGSDTLNIPLMVNDSYVKEIGAWAFSNRSDFTMVSFDQSDYLSLIGTMAFKGSAISGSVNLPAQIKTIGTSAFQDCALLETLYYNSYADISDQCFYRCIALENVIIAAGVTRIGRLSFAGCESLSYVWIPKSVTEINTTAFNNDNNLVIYCYTDSYAHQFAEENDIEYVLLDAPPKEYFVGKSLSLDGDIGVNFYLDLTADEAKSAAVKFSWNVNTEVKTSSVDLSNAKRLTAGYKATCRIAPAEMTGSIFAELLINGEKVGEERYSAKQYADVILSDSYQAAYKGTGARSYDNLKNLILNMLSFGSRAQTAFAVNLDTLADKDSGYIPEVVTADDIPVEEADMTEGLDDYGLSYVGSTLVCLTETTIRHYYKVTDQNKFDAVSNNIFIEGKPASAVEKNGSIYFEINNIPAADLDRDYTLKIGSNEYQYSAFNYIKTALPSDKVEDAVKNLIQVLYRYNQAANAFFA